MFAQPVLVVRGRGRVAAVQCVCILSASLFKKKKATLMTNVWSLFHSDDMVGRILCRSLTPEWLFDLHSRVNRFFTAVVSCSFALAALALCQQPAGAKHC